MVLYCDGILLGSVLNLVEIRREITYKFPINIGRTFSREFRVRGSNLAT